MAGFQGYFVVNPFFDTSAKVLLALLAVFCFLPDSAFAQANGTDVFLQGKYLEIGFAGNGAAGSAGVSPAAGGPFGAYHPRPNAGNTGASTGQIGFRADRGQDGWNTGAPTGGGGAGSDGDFFFPGTPEEGFCVAIDPNADGSSVTNYCNNRRDTLTDITGSFSGYAHTNGVSEVTWSGSITAGTANGLNVTQRYTVAEDDAFVTIEVTLENTTGADMTDVYYMRNVDPDNNVSRSGDFVTSNTIHKQRPINDAAHVYATQADDSYIELSSYDQDARVTHGGFSNRNAYDVWNGVGLNTSGTVTADQAISLAKKFSSIPAGQSRTFTFVYRFAPATALVSLDADAAIDEAGNRSAAITATLFQDITEDVTITLTYLGSAAASDYSVAPGANATSSTQIVIPAGQKTGSVVITGVQDALLEGDEIVLASIASAVNADIAKQTAEVVIFEDDGLCAGNGDLFYTLNRATAEIQRTDFANGTTGIIQLSTVGGTSLRNMTVDSANNRMFVTDRGGSRILSINLDEIPSLSFIPG